MLFPYTYVRHHMERMQRFVNYIFYQVWCRSRKGGPYDLELFNNNPPLKEIMTAFAYADTAAGDRFSSQIEAIYNGFSHLSRSEISQFKRWYQGNNDIEMACANSPTAQLARYVDISLAHKKLSEQLSEFFKGLYSQSLLDLAALRAKIGDIDDHYKKFVKINNAGKCPFCGINDLLGEYHSKREAYDHYLPKVIYPFNSINFKNLVPACHHCNSSYKTSKNPAFTPKDPARATQRRAVFYPYTAAPYEIELHITLRNPDVANLAPVDIDLDFGPAALSEEIDTWKDVYGIEERYRAKLCAENDGKYWLTQVLDEWQVGGRDPNDFMEALQHQTNRRPYAECNFIKRPFLEACQNIGIF